MADGLFLGLQHQAKNAAIPVTDFEVQIDWYENADWRWLTTPGSASWLVHATIAVPPRTPYGMYAGAIVLTQGGDSWSSRSRSPSRRPRAGRRRALTGRSTFGGAGRGRGPGEPALQQRLGLRRQRLDLARRVGRLAVLLPRRAEGAGRRLAVPGQHEWDDAAPYTDLDTLIMGRAENHFQLFGDAVFGAPYILDTVGGSPNTNVGAGVWQFDTATGGAEDSSPRPAQEGLHALGAPPGRLAGRRSSTRRSRSPWAVRRGAGGGRDRHGRGHGQLRRDVRVRASTWPASTAEAFGLASRARRTRSASRTTRTTRARRASRRTSRSNHAARLTVTTALAPTTSTCSSSATRTTTATSRTPRSSRPRRPARRQRVRRAHRAAGRRLPGLGAGLRGRRHARPRTDHRRDPGQRPDGDVRPPARFRPERRSR